MEVNITDLDHSIIHGLLAEALSPRPVMQVSTIGQNGVLNVAPFASTGIICYKPPILFVGISSKEGGGKKDTLKNIEYSGDFVLNVVDEAMADRMIIARTDYPSDVDEFKESGLTPVSGDRVKSPRVKESPVSIECRVMQILQFGETPHIRNVVFGEGLLAHFKDEIYKDGKMDISKKKAMAHFSGDFFCRTRDIFELRTDKANP